VLLGQPTARRTNIFHARLLRLPGAQEKRGTLIPETADLWAGHLHLTISRKREEQKMRTRGTLTTQAFRRGGGKKNKKDLWENRYRKKRYLPYVRDTEEVA